jgi:hypothetical protein
MWVFDGKVFFLYQIVEAHCWELQPVVLPQLENVFIIMVEQLHKQVDMVLLILIAF